MSCASAVSMMENCPCEMKKYVNGRYIELTPEEMADRAAGKRRLELYEKSRPLSADEVIRMVIAEHINSAGLDDATASRAVEFHPVLKQNGSRIAAGTRVNWNGALKRAVKDLTDIEENDPDNAPDLWEDIGYRNGIRVILENIKAGLDFAKNEYGWLGEKLYKSLKDLNDSDPDDSPDAWEEVIR